jgi:hypothetical protein
MEKFAMPQFKQIRESFLANARQHLLETDTQACNCQFQCCQNSSDSSTNENTMRSGNKVD